MKRDAIINQIRALRPKLEAQGVLHLAIYGSRARGDERPDSDLDVLIDEFPDRRFSLYDLIGVQHIISDQLGIDAQATMRKGLNERFRGRIADDVTEVF